MSRLLDEFTPADFGLDRFETYRDIQKEAIEQAVYGEKRFQALALPTGAGKSLVAVSAAKLSGWKTVILTSTKGLQSQYLDDFERYGMADIRGKANYRCKDVANFNCRDGQRVGCRSGECRYMTARNTAQSSSITVTNYAYWLSVKEWPMPDCLILDEAHAAVDELSDHMGVRIYEKELIDLIGREDVRAEELSRWAGQFGMAYGMKRDCGIQLENAMWMLQNEQTRQRAEQVEKLQSLFDRLERIWRMDGEGWVCEYAEGTRYGRVWDFDCVWPGKYNEFLFRNCPRVILMSATLRPKTLDLLNIPEDQMEFKEWPRIFPANRHPIYYIPPKNDEGKTIRMNHGSSDEDLKKWVELIDEIIQPRLDRKGIIQTVSYQRQKFLIEHSRWQAYMIANTSDPDSETAADICQKFKDSAYPVILVSPSFSTGYDFPGCLPPETRLLTSDLRWIPCGEIKSGDLLAGFDEYAPQGKRARKWRYSRVLKTNRLFLPCRRLTLADGTILVCSEDHIWLTNANNGIKWQRASSLRAGPKNFGALYRVSPTWETRHDYNTGYLAAAFDGEGHLYQKFKANKRSNEVSTNTLSFCQVDNEMWDEVDSIMKLDGYVFDVYTHRRREPHHQDKLVIRLRDRMNVLRFLGQVRPVRLTPKFDVSLLGALSPALCVKILENVPIGVREVVSIQTSTRTFVAEGFASHNCECEYIVIPKVPFVPGQSKVMKARKEADESYLNYLAMQDLVQSAGRGMRSSDDRCEVFITDGSLNWFLYQNRRLAPKWFGDAVRKMAEIPKPAEKLKKTV